MEKKVYFHQKMPFSIIVKNLKKKINFDETMKNAIKKKKIDELSDVPNTHEYGR